MNIISIHFRRACLWLSLALLVIPAAAQPVQLVSASGSFFGAASGGNGDSRAPILSPDGRYVLFASTANNLVHFEENSPLPPMFPARLNVYLRDRTAGTTTLVSANVSGVRGGNGDSVPAEISADGRFALFESDASDLVPGDTNNVTDVFLRDLSLGTTRLVSVSTNGGMGNAVSRNPAMTPDGRFVTFTSLAFNLTPKDTNSIADVFIRDMQAGVTTVISAGAKANQPSNPVLGSSEAPDITPDGRFVVFSSTATNLVSKITTTNEIYVRDLMAGVTYLASTNARTVALAAQKFTNVICYNHVISTNGQFVAYEAAPYPFNPLNPDHLISPLSPGIILRYNLQTGLSDVVNTNAAAVILDLGEARSLDMTPDGRFIAFVSNTNGVPGSNTCVYLWDGQAGTTVLVSGAMDGSFPTNSKCAVPVIDATGRYVLFLSNATNLTANAASGDFHLYLRDTQAGTTALVDADPTGAGSAGLSQATFPRLSADGRFVAFEGPDGSLVPGDSNGYTDIMVRDTVANHVELISAHDATLPSLPANRPSFLGPESVSSAGRYVVFTSEANNLAPNDTNRCRDIFVRDLMLGTNLLVSVAMDGINAGNGISTEPAISADGRYVTFTSYATNLTSGNTNDTGDIYVRDLVAGTTVLVSVNGSGAGPGNKPSRLPIISSDGNLVWFRSQALNLTPVATSVMGDNLYLRNLQTATTYALSSNLTITAAAATLDGRWVAFGTASGVYLWNSQTLVSTLVANASAPVAGLVISPDGSRIAYSVASAQVAIPNGLFGIDLAGNTNFTIAASKMAASVSRQGLRFSGDGRFLTYTCALALVAANQNATNDVYLFDFQTLSNILISKSFDSLGAGSGTSDSPDISLDGRFVAYRSFATNLVAGVTNGMVDLYLYDRVKDTTTAVSLSRFGNATSDYYPLKPIFSGGGPLVFQGSSADHNADIYALGFFVGQIVRPGSVGAGTTINWTAAPGASYRVQYKNTLTDAWQDLGGTVTNDGSTGSTVDATPASAQRFYRIVEN